MDDSLRQAGNDAMAMVARSYEPVRIERQLLSRTFDLVCDVRAPMSASTPRSDDTAISAQPFTEEIERRRVA